MGYFSSSDDDEDRPPPPSHCYVPEDDEDDPLDAYMNSLRPSSPSAPTKGRLDHDAEDEATSHWIPTAAPPEEPDQVDATPPTFVRAGFKPNPDQDDDDDELRPEIAPLDSVDHRSVRYEPFTRVFLPPSDTESGGAWRKEHEVTCDPPLDPLWSFDAVEGVFPEEMRKRIATEGYDAPTSVQSQTMGAALAGRDAIVTASTGSGKTLAYLWPMIIHICDQPSITPNQDGPIGLILTPTRELAKQVYKHAKTFMECMDGKVIEVAGGNRGTWELIKVLRVGCEIVVGTPGRVIDVVKKKGTNLKRVTMVVLDEADRMLDMGFEKQVSSILENIRPDRQTLMLSATFGKKVERVARGWLKIPVRIAVGRTGASSEHVDQHVMVLPSVDAKKQWLLEMLPILSPLGRCVVFVSTRADCDLLSSIIASSNSLNLNEASLVSIHGDKDQRDRNFAISKFKKNPNAIMIASDVAARGLDIPDVMTVINFDAAKNIDSHVHRIGRAGRMSKGRSGGIGGEQFQQGVAYTLLTEKNVDFAQSLAEAFEREGRPVSRELVMLCQKSKRYGGGRKIQSKSGLGFVDSGSRLAGRVKYNTANDGRNSGIESPVAKKRRWG